MATTTDERLKAGRGEEGRLPCDGFIASARHGACLCVTLLWLSFHVLQLRQPYASLEVSPIWTPLGSANTGDRGGRWPPPRASATGTLLLVNAQAPTDAVVATGVYSATGLVGLPSITVTNPATVTISSTQVGALVFRGVFASLDETSPCLISITDTVTDNITLDGIVDHCTITITKSVIGITAKQRNILVDYGFWPSAKPTIGVYFAGPTRLLHLIIDTTTIVATRYGIWFASLVGAQTIVSIRAGSVIRAYCPFPALNLDNQTTTCSDVVGVAADAAFGGSLLLSDSFVIAESARGVAVGLQLLSLVAVPPPAVSVVSWLTTMAGRGGVLSLVASHVLVNASGSPTAQDPVSGLCRLGSRMVATGVRVGHMDDGAVLVINTTSDVVVLALASRCRTTGLFIGAMSSAETVTTTLIVTGESLVYATPADLRLADVATFLASNPGSSAAADLSSVTVDVQRVGPKGGPLVAFLNGSHLHCTLRYPVGPSAVTVPAAGTFTVTQVVEDRLWLALNSFTAVNPISMEAFPVAVTAPWNCGCRVLNVGPVDGLATVVALDGSDVDVLAAVNVTLLSAPTPSALVNHIAGRAVVLSTDLPGVQWSDGGVPPSAGVCFSGFSSLRGVSIVMSLTVLNCSTLWLSPTAVTYRPASPNSFIGRCLTFQGALLERPVTPSGLTTLAPAGANVPPPLPDFFNALPCYRCSTALDCDARYALSVSGTAPAACTCLCDPKALLRIDFRLQFTPVRCELVSRSATRESLSQTRSVAPTLSDAVSRSVSFSRGSATFGDTRSDRLSTSKTGMITASVDLTTSQRLRPTRSATRSPTKEYVKPARLVIEESLRDMTPDYLISAAYATSAVTAFTSPAFTAKMSVILRALWSIDCELRGDKLKPVFFLNGVKIGRDATNLVAGAAIVAAVVLLTGLFITKVVFEAANGWKLPMEVSGHVFVGVVGIFLPYAAEYGTLVAVHGGTGRAIAVTVLLAVIGVCAVPFAHVVLKFPLPQAFFHKEDFKRFKAVRRDVFHSAKKSNKKNLLHPPASPGEPLPGAPRSVLEAYVREQEDRRLAAQYRTLGKEQLKEIKKRERLWQRWEMPEKPKFKYITCLRAFYIECRDYRNVLVRAVILEDMVFVGLFSCSAGMLPADAQCNAVQSLNILWSVLHVAYLAKFLPYREMALNAATLLLHVGILALCLCAFAASRFTPLVSVCVQLTIAMLFAYAAAGLGSLALFLYRQFIEPYDDLKTIEEVEDEVRAFMQDPLRAPEANRDNLEVELLKMNEEQDEFTRAHRPGVVEIHISAPLHGKEEVMRITGDANEVTALRAKHPHLVSGKRPILPPEAPRATGLLIGAAAIATIPSGANNKSKGSDDDDDDDGNGTKRDGRRPACRYRSLPLRSHGDSADLFVQSLRTPRHVGPAARNPIAEFAPTVNSARGLSYAPDKGPTVNIFSVLADDENGSDGTHSSDQSGSGSDDDEPKKSSNPLARLFGGKKAKKSKDEKSSESDEDDEKPTGAKKK